MQISLHTSEVLEIEKMGEMLTDDNYHMDDISKLAISIAAKMLGAIRFEKSQLAIKQAEG